MIWATAIWGVWPSIRTPNIDTLAAEMALDHFYVALSARPAARHADWKIARAQRSLRQRNSCVLSG